jgi:hypothetical protein
MSHVPIGGSLLSWFRKWLHEHSSNEEWCFSNRIKERAERNLHSSAYSRLSTTVTDVFLVTENIC